MLLLQLPTTKLWLAIKDAKQRDTAPFHQEMAAQVYEYYFRNYAVHFSSDGMSTAFATIPQVLVFPPPAFVMYSESSSWPCMPSLSGNGAEQQCIDVSPHPSFHLHFPYAVYLSWHQTIMHSTSLFSSAFS